MLRDLLDYLAALFDHTASSIWATLAVGLAIAALFAEPEWAQVAFLAGAALAHASAGFLAWRREKRGLDRALSETGQS